MGMQLLMRKDVFHSPFRSALIELASMDGEKLILSTGYLTLYSKQSNQYNFDPLLKAIKKGFKNVIAPEIIIIGGMFDNNNNIQNFKDFLNNINTNSSQKIKLSFYVANSNKWHSKVALKIRNQKALAAILGSSNLTSSAFAVHSSQKYSVNQESDIFIWKKIGPNKNFKGIRVPAITSQNLNENKDLIIKDLTFYLYKHFNLESTENINLILKWSENNDEEIEDKLLVNFKKIAFEDETPLVLLFQLKKISNQLLFLQNNMQFDSLNNESVLNFYPRGFTTRHFLDELHQELALMVKFFTTKQKLTNGIF